MQPQMAFCSRCRGMRVGWNQRYVLHSLRCRQWRRHSSRLFGLMFLTVVVFLAFPKPSKTVDSIDEAVAHIEEHGSHHSDAIVTENYTRAMHFVDQVDSAAVYVNASTQFTDGAQFGLGAEVGISTQKMHARGPMGLREMTSSLGVFYAAAVTLDWMREALACVLPEWELYATIKPRDDLNESLGRLGPRRALPPRQRLAMLGP